MSAIKRAGKFLFSTYGFTMFLLIMFLLMPAFLIAFMMPRPADGNAVYKISRVWAGLFFLATGIRYREDRKWRPAEDGSYIFVTNHISYIDIPMMVLATRGFHVRILAKAEMGRIPVFGWIYKAGAVTVQRENDDDRKQSIRELKSFLQEKISIMLCPEGTFNMTDQPMKSFYNGAFRIAVELQKPIVPVIFPDTYSRLNYRSVFSLTPGVSRAVFLPEIPTTGLAEEDIPELRDRTHALMAAALLKLGAPWVG